MSALHPACLPVEELHKACEIRFTRRSGPGGQHRNKVETAVILCHLPTNIQAEANERRSQAANRTVALFRLRIKLALHFRASVSPSAVPSPLWSSRLHHGRLSINPTHDDFPALLAEVLDLLSHFQADLPPVVKILGCTTSQLIKFLKLEPLALAQTNAWRQAAGRKALL